MRTLVLGLVLAFSAILLGLTVHAVIKGGPDILTVLSALVLALFVFGVVGALMHPPGE